MYERFTDRAKRVMQLANEETSRLNHGYIGSEHILLGLVKEGGGQGCDVLRNLDVDLRKIRLEVERVVPSGPQMVVMGKVPQIPCAKKVIEYSVEEARNLNHNYVGTGHIVLGLLREIKGVAAIVLSDLGLRLEDVRAEISRKEAVDGGPPIEELPASERTSRLGQIAMGLLRRGGFSTEDIRLLISRATSDASLARIMVTLLLDHTVDDEAFDADLTEQLGAVIEQARPAGGLVDGIENRRIPAAGRRALRGLMSSV